MPVAVEGDRAIFVYIDPAMSNRSPLHSWGQAHRQLWDKLRQASRTVEVFVVAWDQQHLDRTQCVLQAWASRRTGAVETVETEAAGLRQAIAETDWDTVESHGGFNAVVAKILQWERKTPAPRDADRSTNSASGGQGRAVVWVATLQGWGGSRRWCMRLATTTLHYQRAQPSPLWRGLSLEIRIGRGLPRIPRVLCGKAP